MQNRRDSRLPCNTLLFGSLFSGCGGFDLGFDRAGLQCSWQVEIDENCQRILKKHWPEVPKHGDIRTFEPTPVDVVCGGFPCQDISNAGKCEGIDGQRSGLWSEYVRIIRTIRPRFVVVENVAALLVRGLDRVLRDLAACGYDAEWSVLSACQWGYPHARERLFCVAYPNGSELRTSGAAEAQRRTTNVFIDGVSEITPMESRRAIVANVDSAVYGVSGVVDELRPYGNAVIPDMAEWIGRAILRSV
jgi:DNA (cytosine-5)-methyltransferase 1